MPLLDRESQRVTIVQVPLPLQAATGPIAPWHLVDINSHKVGEVSSSIRRNLESLSSQIPLSDRFFLDVERFARLGMNASDAFSWARQSIEAENGILNEEVSMSQLCTSDAWGAFVRYCLSNASKLHAHYNLNLKAFRHENQIKNPTQPVPLLQSKEDWLELPFWLYRSNQRDRQKLWIRTHRGGIQLSQTPSDNSSEPLILSPDANSFEHQWVDFLEQGFCLRPRALITTMYLRCFVSDLFVHGVGGGLYDQLTDRIIRDFLNIHPPEFVIASASLHLQLDSGDLPEFDLVQNEQHELARTFQLLRSNPANYLDVTDPVQAELVNKQHELLSRIPPRPHKREWHRKITSLKESITEHLQSIEHDLLRRQQANESCLSAHRTLRAREYSFVLFNQSDVIERLKNLACAAIGERCTNQG